MSFIRYFDSNLLPTIENPVFRLLHDRIKNGNEECGIVFPALRANRLDFYCGGGVLVEYNGISFKRNPAYNKDIKNKLNSEGKKNIRPISEIMYIERYGKDFVSNFYGFIKEKTVMARWSL